MSILTTQQKIQAAIEKALNDDYPKVALYEMAKVLGNSIDNLKSKYYSQGLEDGISSKEMSL